MEELERVESDLTSISYDELQDNPIKGNFNIAHLKAMHEHIFRDIYDWAGKFRTVDIAKGNTLFCKSSFIEGYLNDVLKKLENENFLINADPNAFPEKLAFYFSEINATHPFRDGNGRTQRAFVEHLGKVAGYEIDFSKATQEQMTEASIYSWKHGESKFADIFKQAISPIPIDKQLDYAKRILPPKSEALKIL